MTLCIARFTQQASSKALATWMEVTEDARARRETMEVALYRIRNRHVVRAYGSWWALTADAVRKQNLLRSALARMSMRMLALVYDAWAGHLERQREVRTILAGCTQRLMMRLTVMVWGAWSEYLDAKRRCRVIAARIEGNHELGQLSNGFSQWQRRVVEKADNDPSCAAASASYATECKGWPTARGATGFTRTSRVASGCGRSPTASCTG